MVKLEREIEAAIYRHAKKLGWLCYKFTSPQRRSVPDRLFIKNGAVIFMEMKATGKKPTKGQLREIAKLQGQGMLVYVVDNVAEGKKLLQKHGSTWLS